MILGSYHHLLKMPMTTGFRLSLQIDDKAIALFKLMMF
jgi:hypothetical protein